MVLLLAKLDIYLTDQINPHNSNVRIQKLVSELYVINRSCWPEVVAEGKCNEAT